MEYYVYVAKDADGKVVYVGSGKGARIEHVTSGHSHNSSLNKHVLDGNILVVEKVSDCMSKQDSLEEEQRLQDLHKPKYNKNRAVGASKKSDVTDHILNSVNRNNSGLDMKEYIVLVTLSGYLNTKTMKCNPSKATLSNQCCMSERTSDEAVRGLVEKGFLTYEKGGMIGKLKNPNKYKLNLKRIFECK